MLHDFFSSDFEKKDFRVVKNALLILLKNKYNNIVLYLLSGLLTNRHRMIATHRKPLIMQLAITREKQK
jgi:hypothetical protein